MDKSLKVKEDEWREKERRKRKIMRTLAFSNWDEKPNVIDLCDDEVENNGQ